MSVEPFAASVVAVAAVTADVADVGDVPNQEAASSSMQRRATLQSGWPRGSVGRQSVHHDEEEDATSSEGGGHTEEEDTWQSGKSGVVMNARAGRNTID